ncbi:MAG: OmpA family protein [Candidatus Aminicenantes bacterium]|nr:OmpA family protein [Candidatus Aminicenantes bacterium]
MKASRKIINGILIILIVTSCLCMAQEVDMEGCKDHPLFTRMKNFYITNCESKFDAVDFYVNDSEYKTIEGQKTMIDYYLKEGSPVPSYLQIIRNFSNALKSIGGTALYEGNRYLCGNLNKNNREIWVSVEGYNDGWEYRLIIVEIEEMIQEVTASEMLDALNRDGFIALYINFDSGKYEIKPESQPTIEQIAQLMKDNPELKLSIEGHTDNVGTPQNNKVLSENRAKAVMNAVISLGVESSRLSAIGWGQEKPIADNRSEEGRAKNRRVEIVKQ